MRNLDGLEFLAVLGTVSYANQSKAQHASATTLSQSTVLKTGLKRHTMPCFDYVHVRPSEDFVRIVHSLDLQGNCLRTIACIVKCRAV